MIKIKPKEMTNKERIEEIKTALAKLEAEIEKEIQKEIQKETFKFPEKWEDVCEFQEIFFLNVNGGIVSQEIKARTEYKNSLPTKEKAEKYLAAMQLEMIAEYCNKFAEKDVKRYQTKLHIGKIEIFEVYADYLFGGIAFHSKEHLEQSIISHKELWLTYLNN